MQPYPEQRFGYCFGNHNTGHGFRNHDSHDLMPTTNKNG